MPTKTWQLYPPGTPAAEDTVLFRDVSDNASNAAGKVKQGTIADLLALLPSGGTGGGGTTGGGGAPAGTFTPVGTFIETTDTSFAWKPDAVGNVLVVIADSTDSNLVTKLDSGNADWKQAVNGTKTGTVTVTLQTAFIGTATATTQQTVTLTTAAAPGSLRVLAHEYSTGGLPVTLDDFAVMNADSDGASVAAWPPVAPKGSGRLLFGYERNIGDGDGAAAAGSTAGVTYYVDANSNGGAFAVNVDSAVTVGWGDTDSRTALVLLLKAGSGGGTAPSTSLVVTPKTADQVSAASVSSHMVATSTTSFTPADGDMVRICATWLDATDQLGKTFTCKDSGGTSYTATIAGGDSDGGCYLLVFDHVYSTSPGAITVAITSSDDATADCLIQPYVISGQASSQAGAATAKVSGNVSVNTCEITLATTAPGSVVMLLGAPNNANHPVPSAITGTITDSEWDDDNVGSHGVTGHSVPTATPGSTKFGWTLSTASVFGFGCVAAEILPASGSAGGALAYTQELYDNFSAASIDHGLYAFPDTTAGLTQSGGTLKIAAAASVEHEIDTSARKDLTAGLWAVRWSHTGTPTPATTPGNDEGTQAYFGFVDSGSHYCELQLTPGSDFWVSWADGVGATVSGDQGDQTAFTSEWTDGDFIGLGDYDVNGDQRLHVYKSPDGATWTEIASFKVTGPIDMSAVAFFVGVNQFTGSSDWVTILDDLSFFERTGAAPVGGGGGGTTAGVPQAPLLGTYPGDGFPGPPSAWPSGAQTNLAATYIAWDLTAADVANFIGECKSNGLIPFVELEPWHFDQSAVLFSSITSGGSDSFLTAIGQAVASAGIPVIFTFAHEMNVSGQYPWSQGMSGSGPGGGNLSAANWVKGWKYVRDKVQASAGGLALFMWACSAWTGGTTIDPSPWWPGSDALEMVGIDGYPNTQFGASLGTFNGQIKPTVDAIRALGWSGDIFLAETNLREMVDSGGQDITSFVADMKANGVSGILEFEDPSWGLSPMTKAQWTAYHNAVTANYGS